jgi:hypothetical protein
VNGILAIGATFVNFQASSRVVGNPRVAKREAAAWRTGWVHDDPLLASSWAHRARGAGEMFWATVLWLMAEMPPYACTA